jgi:teichoic acid transport system permease protein
MSTVTASERARLSGWRSYVKDLLNRREFAWFLAIGNLKARNASTALGLLWWIVNPVLLSLIYFLVFGIIFVRSAEGEPAFLSWLVSGLFMFTYTSTSMTSGANSILANSRLLVNIRFPRLILPISAVIEAGVGFLVSLPVFYLIAWPIDGIGPGVSLIWLPVAVALHTLFNLGLAAGAARLAVPFRDINNIIPHLTRLWMYLSPIIWPTTLLAERSDLAQTLVKLNPLYSFLQLYRGALMGREILTEDVVGAVAWTLAFLLIGVVSFVRYEGNMVRHL